MADIVPTNGASAVTDPFLTLIERAARDPAFDMQKFDALMMARERELARLSHAAFNRSMGLAQADMQAVQRDGKNTYLNARYSTLDAMLKVILPAIAPYGLHVRFGTAPAPTQGWKCVTCIVSHDDGHVEITAMEGPIQQTTGVRGGQTQMNDLQAAGSTTTYLKRYALGMAFTLVLSDEQDDDGEASRPVPRRAPPPTHPPHQVAPQQAPQARTQANGNSDDDRIKRFLNRIHEAMEGAATGVEVDAVNERAKAALAATWPAGAPTAVVAAVTDMARRALNRVAPGQTPQAKPDSTALLTLLAEIAGMDLATLNAQTTDTNFNQRMLALSLDEQEQVDAAMKARAAQLGGAA